MVEISISFSYICFFINGALVESHEIVTPQATLSAYIFWQFLQHTEGKSIVLIEIQKKTDSLVEIGEYFDTFCIC